MFLNRTRKRIPMACDNTRVARCGYTALQQVTTQLRMTRHSNPKLSLKWRAQSLRGHQNCPSFIHLTRGARPAHDNKMNWHASVWWLIRWEEWAQCTKPAAAPSFVDGSRPHSFPIVYRRQYGPTANVMKVQMRLCARLVDHEIKMLSGERNSRRDWK